MDRSARDFLIVLLGIPILRMLVVIRVRISEIDIIRLTVVASR